MQGKGLATALLLCCALLAGCGGGDAEQASSSAVEQASSSATTEASTPREAAAQLQEKERRLKAERRAPKPASHEGTGQEQHAPQPDPHPANPHSDAGGGTAQFVTKGGDNSIQESGQEASQAETEDAAAVLHAYLDARAEHRWDEACFYMTARLVAYVEEIAARYDKESEVEGCAEIFAASTDQGAAQGALVAAAKVDVGSLRIDGDQGFVLYYGPGGQPYAMPVAREGGAWKVASLEGSPLG